MDLNQLSDNVGARQERMRVGRGIGSGKGKTCGRGHKGQKSRSGVRIKGFEGGQMPLFRRLPKRGFVNIFRKKFAEVSLARIQKAIDAGRLEVSAPIDAAALARAGLIRHAGQAVSLLAGGTLMAALDVRVARASKAAAAAVAEAKGQVTAHNMSKDATQADADA